MKRYLYAFAVVIVAAAIFGAANFAFALVDCPAGSHTFSGDTQASSKDMCIPDIPTQTYDSSNQSSQSSQTFTPSTKGAVTPSGTTAQTQKQGIAIDTQVSSEVNRLYGTSIYAQAKALYDSSVSANNTDFNAVSNQVKNLDYDTADALERAYNVRAIGRLNQVWNGIMALETTYAQQQAQKTVAPTPISPTPISPTPISPTPINPTDINPTDINPTPINPTDITPQYYDATDIKPSQIISAPINQPANIVTADQNISMQAGSIIKFVSQNTWQTVNGIFRFLEKTAINGRYKVRTNGGAVVSVRGTQFIINETPDVTTITLIKGALSVTPAKKGKPAVNLKEGYQLVVTKGVLGKPTKFAADTLDTSWYENMPAGQNFLDSSWTKEAAANRYRRESVYTAGAATAAETLTAEEQQYLDVINQGLAVFRKKTTDTIIEKDKRDFSAMEKTNASGAASVQFYISSKGIYYSGDKGKTWKIFQNKNLVNDLFKTLRKENLAYGFDKDTFVFSNWEGTGKNRLAVYTGKLSSDGTDDLISGATGQNQEEGQPVAAAKIYIDEESQLWTKIEANVNVKSGKLVFPLLMTGTATYGDAIKVALPTKKVKNVNAKSGLAELQTLIGAAR